VAEGAGPQVIAVPERTVGPATKVPVAVVVAAEGSEVLAAGGPASGPGDAVVEIAVGGGHTAAREHAGPVA